MPEDNKKDTNATPADSNVPEGGSSETENKPLSPEAEIVAINKAAKSKSPEAPAENIPSAEVKPAVKTVKPKAVDTTKMPAKKMPTQIGKETAKKSTTRFLIIMGLGLAGLFVLFVVLMVLMIAGGGGQSPILAGLGINASGIKGFLLNVINLSFGLLAMLFFVLSVIGVFRLLFAKKGDKEARGKGIRMSLIGILPFFVIVSIWLVLVTYINRIVINSERVKAEIVVIQPEDVTNLIAPVEITFSSENVVKSLKASNLQVTGGSWDFNGDGVFETPIVSDFQMSYLYNNKGNYNVGLEVNVNGEKEPRKYSYPLSIVDAYFDAKPATGTAPLSVAFDASNLIGKGSKVQSMDWDFNGDGTYDISGKDKNSVTYKFDQVGTFKVHLRIVYDNNLVENYYRDIVVVLASAPLVSVDIAATPSLTGQIPLQIRFDGSKSNSQKGTIVGYEWDLGDGSPVQKGQTVSHIYNNPGTYNVTLTATDSTGITGTQTVTVEAKGVSSPPVAKIVTTPAVDKDGKLNGEAPLKVSFDASSSSEVNGDIVDYNWDFGTGGSSQSGQKTDYTYDKAGTYTATLTVKDSQGQTGTATIPVEITEPGVKAAIIANPEEGTAPLTVNFDGSSSSAFTGNIVSYEWDFGDKSPKTITSAQISHKYADVGTYDVTLNVTTNQNMTATATKQIYVREIPLRACFEPSRRNGEAPLAVTFDSKCSTGTVSKYSWNFGDGSDPVDGRKPSHTFDNPGNYNVTLEVTDDKNNVNSFSDVVVATGDVQPAGDTQPAGGAQ
jgi:PKD repeat protein